MTKKTGATTQTGRPPMDSDSPTEHLDGRALAFINAECRLMEAKSGHTEGSRTNDSASFPCCGRTASSFSSRLVDDSCLPGIRDRPVSHRRGGGGSKLRDSNIDLFP